MTSSIPPAGLDLSFQRESSIPPAGLDLSETPSSTLITAGVKKTAPPTEWSLVEPTADGKQIVYTFDAWLRLNHANAITVTQHPVQSGADITDHAYVNPKRFSFDIGVTDTVATGRFSANPTRSINAYNTIQQLQARRVPLTLVSKYGVYENILIESLEASDDYQTSTALKATINLIEIIIADVQVYKLSAAQMATDITNRGNVPALPEFGTIQSIKLKLEALFPFIKL